MPSFRLHTGNALELLAERLHHRLRAAPPDPFATEQIIVQSLGMARWLALDLARRTGICAQTRFPFPNAFINFVFRELVGQPPDPSPFAQEVLTWKILRLLPPLLEIPAFRSLDHYLHDPDQPDDRPLRRYQLAVKIAYLYDQYLIYRPDYITGWEAGQDNHWQAILWRTLAADLAAHAPASDPSALPAHPAALRQRLLARLASAEPLPSTLPARVSIFGIAALPPFHLDIFHALSRHLEVNIFLLQPTPEYWGDILSDRDQARLRRWRARRNALRSKENPAAAVALADSQPPDADDGLHLRRGHPLLAGLGKMGRDFFNELLEYNFAEEDDLAFFDPAEQNQPSAPTLLARLQSDILHLRDRPSERLAPDYDHSAVEDFPDLPILSAPAASPIGSPSPSAYPAPSLSFHACHSPLREMEVIQDQILDLLRRDPDLRPHDFLVMTPDIEAYTPAIEAVFGTPENDRLRLPHSIADRSPLADSPVVQTFISLLDLPDSRFGATAILELLECSALRARFRFTDADLRQIRRWTESTRIRWGRDSSHRHHLQLPDLPENTWRAGLDRLLLGHALRPLLPDTLFHSLAPGGPLSSDQRQLLGRLATCADQLFSAARSLRNPRPLAEWDTALQKTLSDFFASDGEADTDRELRALRDTLVLLASANTLSRHTEPVDNETLRAHLAALLGDDRRGFGFLAGSITFCALRPMRSIPFKVIILAGLNEGEFPRQSHRPGFDLMSAHPRPGDRTVRDDDRYLFLEALLSARSHLLLVWTGQSPKDNQPTPPSVVISELLDHLQDAYALDPRALVLRHPLQPFSARYFSGQHPRLFSYSAANRLAAEQIHRQTLAPRPPSPFLPDPLPEPDPEWRRLDLRQLLAFLDNPARHLLEKRLGLRLDPRPDIPDDTEPFHLDSLQSYLLRTRLLQRLLDPAFADDPAAARLHAAALLPVLTAEGLLPHGQVGRATFADLLRHTADFAATLQPYRHWRPLPDLPFVLQQDNFTLTGLLTHRTDHGLLRPRPATLKPRDLIRAWLHHLVHSILPGSGQPRPTLLAGSDTLRLHPPLPESEARRHLSAILQLYWRGLRQPLPFFPATSLAYAQARLRNTAADPLKAAATQWHPPAGPGSETAAPRDSQDPFVQICFHHTSPLDDPDFAQAAETLLTPLLQG